MKKFSLVAVMLILAASVFTGCDVQQPVQRELMAGTASTQNI